jgi:hypothetical protein
MMPDEERAARAPMGRNVHWNEPALADVAARYPGIDATLYCG